ncbi:MAG: DUF4304 domain-containing protein [Bacteroidia bacterium]|nr:DUF4304 domain-containing protein [Bacteroidia bacterium]
MDIYKQLRKQSIDPTFKKNGFKRAGKIFSRELEGGVVYIIEVNVYPIVKNDFSLSINYGIYFKGVIELLFGFPFEIKRGVASCVYRSYMRDKKFQCHWNSNKFTSAEVFYDEVSASIENNIILFLNNVTTCEKLLELFQSGITIY